MKTCPCPTPLGFSWKVFWEVCVEDFTGNYGVFCISEKGDRAGANRKKRLRLKIF